MTFETLLLLCASTLRTSTPLIFAALGGLFSERSGVINIALEGFMIIGAFAAAVAAHFASGAEPAWAPTIGLVAAALAGAALAALYAAIVIGARGDQIVSGTAINLLAAGITPFLCKILFNVSGATPALGIERRFTWAPMALAWIALVLTQLWLTRTSSGLWVRFAGEHPKALSASGISVKRVRFTAVLMSGALAGLGGASLSLMLSSSFARNMTAGRGFMALAALIFGKWKPIPTLCACLLFGFTDALQIQLQGVLLPGFQEPIPVQFIQILPYLATMGILAGFVGKSRAPKALGQAF